MKINASKMKQNIKALERRYDFLCDRVRLAKKDLTFDRLECDALEWAIERLKLHYSEQLHVGKTKDTP